MDERTTRDDGRGDSRNDGRNDGNVRHDGPAAIAIMLVTIALIVLVVASLV